MVKHEMGFLLSYVSMKLQTRSDFDWKSRDNMLKCTIEECYILNVLHLDISAGGKFQLDWTHKIGFLVCINQNQNLCTRVPVLGS